MCEIGDGAGAGPKPEAKLSIIVVKIMADRMTTLHARGVAAT